MRPGSTAGGARAFEALAAGGRVFWVRASPTGVRASAFGVGHRRRDRRIGLGGEPVGDLRGVVFRLRNVGLHRDGW